MSGLALVGTATSFESTALDSFNHAVAPVEGGGFAAVWREVTGFGFTEVTLEIGQFTAEGAPVGNGVSDTFVPDNLFQALLNPDIAGLSGGGALAMWNNERSDDPTLQALFGQRLNASGNPQGGEFSVADSNASSVTDVAIATLNSGNIAIAYEFQSDVWTEVISPSGASVVGPTRANAFPSNAQDNPDVAALENGGYVVVWESFNNFGQGDEIFARIYDAAGDAVDEIVVNNVLPGDQTNPAVAGLVGGDFVVVWESENNGASSIRSAIYDDQGNRSNGFEPTLNDLDLDGRDGEVAVTALSSGGFAVAYVEASDGQPEIAVRRFDTSERAEGEPFGDSLRIPSDDRLSFQGEPQIVEMANGDLAVTWRARNSDNGNSQDLFVQQIELVTPGQEITGTGRNDTLEGSIGDDTITGRGGSDSLNGLAGNDILNGGIGFDTIQGGLGDDTIQGLDGVDSLRGGAGNDSIEGNNGSDVLDGQSGDDTINGGFGADDMRGGADNDTMLGLEGFDTLDGEDGNDTLQGNAGNDSLLGGAGNDQLFGGFGADILDGGEGDDRLAAGNGFDMLEGGAGVDRLEGNAGNDTMDGGAGNDILRGGLGADSFVFGVGGGGDIITDFQNNVDQIVLDAALFDEATPVPDDITNYVTRGPGNIVVLDFGDGDTLTFNRVTSAQSLIDDVVISG